MGIITHVMVFLIGTWATYWIMKRQYSIDSDLLNWAKQIVADYRIQQMAEKDRIDQIVKDSAKYTKQVMKEYDTAQPHHGATLQETPMKKVLSNATTPLTELAIVHDTRSDEQISEYQAAKSAHARLQKMVG
jgi:hypothetical protein